MSLRSPWWIKLQLPKYVIGNTSVLITLSDSFVWIVCPGRLSSPGYTDVLQKLQTYILLV